MSDNKFGQEHFSETGTENEVNENGAEDYTFIQETMRPKKKTKWKKLVFTIVLGVTFGGVACFTFCAFYPVFSDLLNLKQDSISLHTDNPNNLSTKEPVRSQ